MVETLAVDWILIGSDATSEFLMDFHSSDPEQNTDLYGDCQWKLRISVKNVFIL